MTMTTTVPAPINTTQALEIAGFERYDYKDYSIVDISENYNLCPILYSVTSLGRLKALGRDMNALGVNENLTINFPTHKWDERNSYNIDFQCNGTIDSSTTTLVLVSTAGLISNSILQNKETDERFRIVSVDSATQVTIQRGVGETAAAAITSGDKLQFISVSSADGVASESSFFVANATEFNYFQKVITTVTMTDFQKLSNKIGNYEDRIMGEKLAQHLESLERIALFGERSTKVDQAGRPYYTARGLATHCLLGWKDDISGGLTKETFEESLDNCLRYGSRNKILMGSAKAIRAVQALYDENKVYNDNIEEINLKFKKLSTNFGDFTIMSHPYLDHSQHDNKIFVLDLKFIKITYPQAPAGAIMPGMDGKTTFEVNKAETTKAKQEGSYFTYITFELANKNAFAAISVL